MHSGSYVKLVIPSGPKTRPSPICRALRMFSFARPFPLLTLWWVAGQRKNWEEHKTRGGGGQGHMSSLPGPEPCRWLHRSLSQPRTKISLDMASDRPAPAALAGQTQTHTDTQRTSRYLSCPARFLHFSNSSFFQPGCLSRSPPTATGPWGLAKSPRR